MILRDVQMHPMQGNQDLPGTRVLSRMSHMAFDLRSNTLAPMFKASSIMILVTAMHFLVLTSAVNKERFLVVITSISEGTTISSFPEKELYSSLRLL